ncbi:hypothetical protein [Arthrobacter sp. NPDC089319]|uniref:bestrophin-like domain n=1 Tax=Arthrobacter sp. NPDC089319 TaxID=3155915 RepID=UPI003444A852
MEEEDVNVVIGFAVGIVITAITITAMLLVRKRAPAGSYFSDGDRASGVFGVLATGFSVLLGFIIVIAFQSYDESRAGAEMEAEIVLQQVQTAQFLPADTAEDLTGQLVCYARSVIGPQWDALERGQLSESINPWGGQMYLTIKAAHPQSTAEQSAYDRWMDQTGERERARVDRIHAAQGLVPLPLWIALFTIFVVILVYMLFFADPDEGAVTQSMLMGSVTLIITTLLALLVFFNNPHGPGLGQLRPTAMERTARQIDAELDFAGLDLTPPCDSNGIAH